MTKLQPAVADLYYQIEQATKRLELAGLKEELDSFKKQSTEPDFWQDSARAQTTMKRLSALEARVVPWQKLLASAADLNELALLDDPKLSNDISRQLEKLKQEFEAKKNDLKLAGLYDDRDVIMRIHAGAGGTDAQDWAQILLRMYSRWAEKNGLKMQTIEQSAGEEAGLKSITLEVEGDFAYGKLKGEHGVHRLVRLSPFNADSLRQTSFAKVEILPKIDQPSDLNIDEKDLKIDVYRAGGHGGQSVNTTDSAVRITHLPTSIAVAIQNERSQLQNKEMAMTVLRSRLAQLQMEQHQEKLDQIKGPNQSAEWGNQIRSYVLHPYKQVKDLRTKHETSDAESVLDGDLNPFIDAYLEHII